MTTQQFGNVTGGEHGVNVREARRVGRNRAGLDVMAPSGVHFGTAGFEDLGRAGGDSHNLDVARICVVEELRSPHLGEHAAHLNRALGRGQMRQEVGVESFGVANPSRAAAREVRQRMVSSAFEFGTALAEHPVLNLAHEFRAFFHDGLVSGAVDVVGLEAQFFKGVHHLIGGEIAGLTAEFFGNRHANGRGGVSHHDVALVSEHFVDRVHKAHLFDGIERAADQALTAGHTALIVNLVLGAKMTLNSIDRADLAASIAGFAQVLIDFDDAAQLAFADVADKIGAVQTEGICRRIEVLILMVFALIFRDLLFF